MLEDTTDPGPDPAPRIPWDCPWVKPYCTRSGKPVLAEESHCEAVVRLGWARHEGGVVLLERVPRAKRNAVVIYVLKAYRKARATWRDGEVLGGNEPGNMMHEEIVA